MRTQISFAALLTVLTIQASEGREPGEPFILIGDVTYIATSQGVPPNGIQCPSQPLKTMFERKCNFKQSCLHDNVHPSTLCQDPGGGPKRLRVSYTCNWTAPRSAGPTPTPNPGTVFSPGVDELVPVRQEVTGDGGANIRLNCTGTTPIPVTTARIKPIAAEWGAGTGNCPTGQFLKFVNRVCDGKPSCKFRIDNEICPGDPNNGVPKTASVRYECRYVWYNWAAGASPPSGFPAQLAPPTVMTSKTDGQELEISCE